MSKKKGRPHEELAPAELQERVDALAMATPETESLRLNFGDLIDNLTERKAPWPYTQHTYGYIAPSPPGSEPLPIRHASDMEADLTLAGQQIVVSLDALQAADYPGKGTHRILFTFNAQNQVKGQTENVSYSLTVRGFEGQQVGVIGFPIFVGLNVGHNGIAFHCSTVNIGNTEDDNLLGFLDSNVLKQGLKLATKAQPALAPLTEMATGIYDAFKNRHHNVEVQDVRMGLDFSYNATGARLAEGSYIAVQIPPGIHWEWSEWVFNRRSGQVVKQTGKNELIPYNYLIFSIRRYKEEPEGI